MSVDQASPSAERSSTVRAGLWRRIAVTLAALGLARLAVHIPVPGLSSRTLANLYGPDGGTAAVERMSILSLDVLPIISIMCLAELGRITIADVRVFAQRHPAKFQRIVLAGGLAVAAFQSAGVAIALDRIPKFFVEPGPASTFAVFASILAGTALAVWLASLIDRHGVGCGIWLIYLAPVLGALYYAVPAHFTAVLSGLITAELSVAVVLGLLAGAVAIVGLMMARPGVAAMQLIWPAVIGYTAIRWLSAPLAVLDQTPLALTLLSPSSPLYLGVYATLVAAVYLLRAKAEQADRKAPAARSPFEPVRSQYGAAALVVLLVVLIGNEAAHALTPTDAQIAGGMILTLLVVVAVTVLRSLGLVR